MVAKEEVGRRARGVRVAAGTGVPAPQPLSPAGRPGVTSPPVPSPGPPA